MIKLDRLFLIIENMQIKHFIKKIFARIGLIHPSLGIKIRPEQKAAILLQYKTPATKVFVETGTETGWMVEKIGGNFGRVYSVELDDHLYNKAKERFQDKQAIRLLHGDSATEIIKILGELKSPALFWLDAHMGGEITASNAPIIKELEAIFA